MDGLLNGWWINGWRRKKKLYGDDRFDEGMVDKRLEEEEEVEEVAAVEEEACGG